MTDVAFFGETATSTVVTSSVLFDMVGDIQGGEGGGGSAGSGGGDMRLVFEVHSCASTSAANAHVRL